MRTPKYCEEFVLVFRDVKIRCELGILPDPARLAFDTHAGLRVHTVDFKVPFGESCFPTKASVLSEAAAAIHYGY